MGSEVEQDDSQVKRSDADRSAPASTDGQSRSTYSASGGGLPASGNQAERARRAVRVIGQPGTNDGESGQSAQQEEPPSAKVPPAPGGPTHKVRSDLRSEELVKGTHPGDRYIRYRQSVGPFRQRGGGVLAASLATDVPRSRFGRAFNQLKRTLIGTPISTERSIHERLTKVKALAVLSSDALSSVAYATEEILRVLIGAGVAVLADSIWVGLGVMALLAIVSISYRQTIAAYPRGGGSYIVAKDNLGTMAGLTAAASILIDYTMTVAVSSAAGIDAIISLFPEVLKFKVEICLFVVVLLTLANLRGVREAGNLFAVPTYLFIVGIMAMMGLGLYRTFVAGGIAYIPPAQTLAPGAFAITPFLLLRAFSQGCTALTGVEAISDGVPAFKPPEAKNARITLLWMAFLAITMFGGITVLASRMHVLPSDQETVLSQVARNVFSAGPGWFSGTAWFYINITTALILVLAANTAFSDFPRLSYFLARDRFMPHQFSFRGDRLAFSWGIVTLAALACALIIGFNGNVTALIPLYTVGVFNSFTLSQVGMVVRWWRSRTPGWQRSMIINGIGALATFVVLIISAVTKFLLGAWIVIVLIPVLIILFKTIERHYRTFSEDVEPVMPLSPTSFKHTIIVPVAKVNKIAMSALAYARSLSPNVTAVHIAEGEDQEEVTRFNEAWHKLLPDTDISLVIIESPFRSLIGPLMAYIDALDQQNPDDTVTIVLAELLPSKPWEYLLHNQTALSLKARLLFRPNTVVANLPYVHARGPNRLERPDQHNFFRDFPFVPVFFAVIVLVTIYMIFLPHR